MNVNLGRECKFYAIIPPGQRSKGGTTKAIKKEKAHKRLNIRMALHVVALEIYMTGKGNVLNISTPNRPDDGGRYERSPGVAPSTYNTAERLQRTQPAKGEVKKWAQERECWRKSSTDSSQK